MARIAAWLIPFVLYALTAYRSVGFWDVGEMDVIPWMFGVAHPPGMPLYVAIGWLWSHVVPFGNVAWRMSLLSALAMSVAAWIAAEIVVELRGDRIAALCAALIFSCGSVAWSIATRADAHAVETLFVALTLLALVRWYRDGSERTFVLACALYGATIAVHPVGLWIVGGFIVLLIARLQDVPFSTIARGIIVAAVAGAVPYLLLPRDVAFASDVAVRGAFHGFDRFLISLIFEFWFALALAGAGVYVAMRLREWRIVALVLAALGSTMFALSFPEESDLGRYFLPLFFALSVAMGYAISFERIRIVGRVVTVSTLVWLVVQGQHFFHQPYDTRALDQSNDVLAHTPEDAVLVATWVLAPTLMYRRDVDRATGNRMIVSSWYGDVDDRIPGWSKVRAVFVVGTPEGSVPGFRLERIAAQAELYRVEPSTSSSTNF